MPSTEPTTVRANPGRPSLPAFIRRLDSPKVSSKRELATSLSRQLVFRDFDFSFRGDVSFIPRIPKRIDLRLGIFLGANGDLPERLRRALRRERVPHVAPGNGLCAGFALGTSRREDGGLHQYIFTLQSHLAFSRQSVVRRYIRGWRKVLFLCILSEAWSKGVARLYLARAADVYRAAFTGWRPAGRKCPSIWPQIYDRTGRDFNMTPAVTPPVNIQTLYRRRACLSRRFYLLDLRRFRQQIAS